MVSACKRTASVQSMPDGGTCGAELPAQRNHTAAGREVRRKGGQQLLGRRQRWRQRRQAGRQEGPSALLTVVYRIGRAPTSAPGTDDALLPGQSVLGSLVSEATGARGSGSQARPMTASAREDEAISHASTDAVEDRVAASSDAALQPAGVTMNGAASLDAAWAPSAASSDAAGAPLATAADAAYCSETANVMATR